MLKTQKKLKFLPVCELPYWGYTTSRNTETEKILKSKSEPKNILKQFPIYIIIQFPVTSSVICLPDSVH